ncbi:unnamed protein product [Pedinophyceae sp. YPF-701]|nr:unnamed protein product [Pedinophyceae sp. YPF-701]
MEAVAPDLARIDWTSQGHALVLAWLGASAGAVIDALLPAEGSKLTWDTQEVFAGLLERSAPVEYDANRKSVLDVTRGLMRRCESDAEEPSDAVADLFARLSASAAPSGECSTPWRERTYCFARTDADNNNNNNTPPPEYRLATSLWDASGGPSADFATVTVRCVDDVLANGTGTASWAAGVYLAQYVMRHPDVVRGRGVLELGCGTGLVGVCVLHGGPRCVVLTDNNPSALENAQHNVRRWQEANPGSQARDVAFEELAWGEAVPASIAERVADGGVVLAADVTYDAHNHVPLSRTLAALLSGGCARALVASTVRCADTMASWRAACEAAGLRVESVADSRQDAEGGVRVLGVEWGSETVGAWVELQAVTKR